MNKIRLPFLMTVFCFVVACAGNNNNNNQNTPVAATPPVNNNNCAMGVGGSVNWGMNGCMGTQNGIASAPPMNIACLTGSINCQMDMYNQIGFTPYQINPYQWGGYFNYYNQQFGGMGAGNLNFCNCPAGTRPVYNGMAGLGCVQISVITPFMNAMVYYGLPAQNHQFVNTPQYSNMNVSANGCFQTVGQACFINQPNSCGAGSFCQITAPASNIGVCVSNGSTPGQGMPNPR